MEEIQTEKQAPAPEGPGFRARMTRLVIGGVVLGLAAATLYLLAERNSRFYYLSQEEDRLVVYRGAWLPSGKRPYLPDDPHTAQIYAPVELPPGAAAPGEQRFEERQDLDRALFEILADLARERIRSEEEEVMQEGFALVERASRLPGITGEQAKALRSMRAELSFFEGRGHLERALVELRQAREKLEHATEASSSRGRAAASLLRSVVPGAEVLSRALQRSRGWEVPELRPVIEEDEEEGAVQVEAEGARPEALPARAGGAVAAPAEAPATDEAPTAEPDELRAEEEAEELEEAEEAEAAPSEEATR